MTCQSSTESLWQRKAYFFFISLHRNNHNAAYCTMLVIFWTQDRVRFYERQKIRLNYSCLVYLQHSFYKWIFHPFLILGYCLDYHIVLLSCCLFHYIYWHQAVIANQGKIWGISRNTIFFSLVTRASSCCDLGHCHSLNAVELPHFTLGMVLDITEELVPVAFASRRLQHNWQNSWKKLSFQSFGSE